MSARDFREQRDRVEAVKAAASFERVAEEFGVEWERDGSGRLKTQCLWHDDTDPSLKVESGQAHARCYSVCGRNYDVLDLVQRVRNCSFGEALDWLGERYGLAHPPPAPKPRRRQPQASPQRPAAQVKEKPKRVRSLGETARWTLLGEAGEYVAEHVRVEHEMSDGTREKAVYWQRHGEKGLGGRSLSDLPLYRSEHVASWPPDTLVALTEGEKACDALVAAGIEHVLATVCGAGSCPSPARLEVLRGRRVVIWRDADQPGVDHARKLAAALTDIAAEVRVYVRETGKKGADAADHPAVISGDPEALTGLREELDSAPLAWDTLPAEEQPGNVLPLRAIGGAPGGSGGQGGSGGSSPANQQLHRTDLGNARRLVALHGDKIRYVGRWARFVVWDGQRWTIDHMCQVERWAKDVPDAILDEAKQINDKDERKKHLAWSLQAESASRIKAMIELLKSEPGIPIDHGEFDANPMLITAANGTIDLRTGDLRPHDPSDLITKIAPVEYDPGATCPKWDVMIERILPDPEVRAFVKRGCGFSATGRSGQSGDQALLMPYGTGANGKSTLLGALVDALGDYAQHTAPDLLVKQRSDHPTVLADLFGVRALVSIETDQGVRLNEALIKRLTGGDRIRARRMREDLWEFDPTHTVWFAVNHRPEVKGTEHAIWRRVKVIPFTTQIPEREQNKQLSEELKDERPGILRWIVEGCLEWQRTGLSEPEAVRVATREYREEMDVLAAFLDERCVADARAQVEAEALYVAYEKWCQAQREDPLSQRALGFALKERGFDNSSRVTSGPRKGRKKWAGIGLLSTDDDPDGDQHSEAARFTESASSAAQEGENQSSLSEEPPQKGASRFTDGENNEHKVHRANSLQNRDESTPDEVGSEPSEPESAFDQEKMLTNGINAKDGSLGSPGSPAGDSNVDSATLEPHLVGAPPDPDEHDIDARMARARELAEQARLEREGRS